MGSIKINVDRFFSVKSNMGGIGDIFRDHSGNILFYFSKEIRPDSTILTEIIAIREGLFIAILSQWSSLSPFYLELDSVNAVVWFKDNFQAP